MLIDCVIPFIRYHILPLTTLLATVDFGLLLISESYYAAKGGGKRNQLIRRLTMRKLIGMALAVLLILSMTACNNGGTPKNTIASADLTSEQQEIIDLLSSPSQEILLFDYQTKDVYKHMKVWIEVYEKGELVEDPAGITMGNDTPVSWDGRVAILINQTPDFQWTIVDHDGSHYVYRPQDTAGAVVDASLARTYGAMSDSAGIESGQEIILYSSVFSSGNLSMSIDSTTLRDNPEMLKQFDYVHLVKCKFE
jgi:hypothetical protein